MLFRIKHQEQELKTVDCCKDQQINNNTTTENGTTTQKAGKVPKWRLFLIRRMSPKLRLFSNNNNNKKNTKSLHDEKKLPDPPAERHQCPLMMLSKVMLAPQNDSVPAGSATEMENSSGSNSSNDDDCCPPISQIQVQQNGDSMSVLMYLNSTEAAYENLVHKKDQSEPVCVDDYNGDEYSIISKLTMDPSLLKEKQRPKYQKSESMHSITDESMYTSITTKVPTFKQKSILKKPIFHSINEFRETENANTGHNDNDNDNDADPQQPSSILLIVSSDEEEEEGQQNKRKSISVLTTDPVLLQQINDDYEDNVYELEMNEEQQKCISVLTMDPSLLTFNEYGEDDESKKTEYEYKRKNSQALAMETALMQFDGYIDYNNDDDASRMTGPMIQSASKRNDYGEKVKL